MLQAQQCRRYCARGCPQNSHASDFQSRPARSLASHARQTVIQCCGCHSRVVLQRPKPFRRANTIVGAAATAEGVRNAAALPAVICHSCAGHCSYCGALQAVSDTKFAEYVPRTAFLFPGQGAQTVGMGKVRRSAHGAAAFRDPCAALDRQGHPSCRMCTSKCRQRRRSSTARQRSWVMTS